MAKIALIGAGSVVFSKNLLCDILQNSALEESTVCLMDIDPVRLDVAERLSRKVVAQLGNKATIEATQDLKTACTGAKYVITMIQVGGYKPATVTDFKIPEKYGLRQTIADTLGVGGVFRALRTMPELVKVGNALRDHGAQNPLFLNYSNPMAMNMMAIDKVCGIPSVGLCHSVQGTSRQLAGYAGIPYEDVSYKVAGINHVAFFLEFRYRGQDAYPLLFDALDNPQVFAADKVRFEMMRRLGYFVTESSEHFSEYCPWFIHHGPKMIKDFDIPLDEYLRRCESIIATWKNTEKRMLSDSAVSIGKSVEYGAQIINAIESGQQTVVYGNVPNRGLISNLPALCSVEVPCLVDSLGLQPTVVGNLPPQLAAMCRTNIAVQELTVEAFLTGKREHIYHAVMMDPHTSSQLPLDKIWSMCDELIETHQRDGFLPQFQAVKKNTGRTASTLDRVRVSIGKRSPGPLNNAKADLQIHVENRTAQSFSGTFDLEFDREAWRVAKISRFECKLAPGATRDIPFQLHRLKPLAPLEVHVRSQSPAVLAQSFKETERQVVKPGPKAVLVEWSGNTVAEGDLLLGKDGVELSLHVCDTDILVNKDMFWDGSVIELFFASMEEDVLTPSQVICLPSPSKPSVCASCGRRKLPGARLTVRADKSGYDAKILVPWASVGAKSGERFLMQIMVRVNALGDAHGRVSSTWQAGPLAPHLSTAGFAIIAP